MISHVLPIVGARGGMATLLLYAPAASRRQTPLGVITAPTHRSSQMKDRKVPMRYRCAVCVLVAGWLLGVSGAAAQATGGAFAGRVHDESGGALPYAQVAITNV